ncbi:uncharacterized protein METZ01_LOCUS202240 [marine metagenome]|uniref:Uncharacterized protein n=1 Tax=marine metagenome TaxID=408172 RepID=A0A382EF23_9ZZZZ
MEAVLYDAPLALAGRGLCHGGGTFPAGVVIGEAEGREVAERTGPFDVAVHVGQLVLHGLERADRHAELVAFLHVSEVQVEDPLAGADGGECYGGSGFLEGPADCIGRVSRAQEPVTVDVHSVEVDSGMPGGRVDGIQGF